MSNISKVVGSSSDTKEENLAMNKFAGNGFYQSLLSVPQYIMSVSSLALVADNP